MSYIATSAWIMASCSPAICSSRKTTPMLARHATAGDRGARALTPPTSACSCSATSAAWSGATLLSRIANSSPPSRATASVPRTRSLQRGGHELEQVVARLVAEGVVDGLEAVEVHEQERGLLAVAPTARDLATELLLEAPPVPQIGQRIVVGEALQRGLHALAHRDVLDVDDEVDGLTVGVAHQRARDLGPDQLPAGGEVDLLHARSARSARRAGLRPASRSASRSSGCVIPGRVSARSSCSE